MSVKWATKCTQYPLFVWQRWNWKFPGKVLTSTIDRIKGAREISQHLT